MSIKRLFSLCLSVESHIGNLMTVGKRLGNQQHRGSVMAILVISDEYRLADLMRLSSLHSRRYSVCGRREDLRDIYKVISVTSIK